MDTRPAGFQELLNSSVQHHGLAPMQSTSGITDPFAMPSAKDEMQTPSVAIADPFSSFSRGASLDAMLHSLTCSLLLDQLSHA